MRKMSHAIDTTLMHEQMQSTLTTCVVTADGVMVHRVPLIPFITYKNKFISIIISHFETNAIES